jgi:glutathione S-transferase
MNEPATLPAATERLAGLAKRLPTSIRNPNRSTVERLIHYSYEEVTRLFDSGLSEQQVPVVLYRDPALWCPYCQRVQFYLEERKIPYRTVHIPMRCYETEENPKPRWYLAMVPSGLLPAVKLMPSGLLLTESLHIMEFFEEQRAFYSYPAAHARDGPAQERKEKLLRLERKLFSDWLRYLTGSVFMADRLREEFLQTMDALEQAIAASPSAPFLSVLESGNSQGPGLVDCAIAPFLERIEYSIPFWKGIEIRRNPRWPRLEEWYQEIEKRPSYLKANAYSTVMNLPPQIGRCTTARSELEAAAQIQERVMHEAERETWVTYIPEHSCPPDVRRARFEAAAAIVRNFARVAGDMKKHCQPQPTEDGCIEEALCSAAQVLIEGSINSVPPVTSAVARKALEHIRNRVCVPRDLDIHAGKQFCGAVNELLAGSTK